MGALIAEPDGLIANIASFPQSRARHLAGRMAVALQAAALIRTASTAITDIFLATRLAAPAIAFGELPPGRNVAAVIDRAWPVD